MTNADENGFALAAIWPARSPPFATRMLDLIAAIT